MGMSERLDQEVQNVDSALKAGADDRSEDCLSAGADPSAVAAPDFAVDYGGSDGLFPLVAQVAQSGKKMNFFGCRNERLGKLDAGGVRAEGRFGLWCGAKGVVV